MASTTCPRVALATLHCRSTTKAGPPWRWSQDGSGRVKALQGETAAYGFYLYGDTTGSVDALRYESFAPMEMFPFSGMTVSCNVYSLVCSRSGQAIGLISNTVNRVDNSVRMRGRVTVHLD